MFAKHLTYSSPNLREAYMYLAFAHSKRVVGNECYYDLVRDADGLPVPRDQCEVAYIDASGELCDPYLWSSDCVTELMRYGGDQDVITHAYIFSWSPADHAKASLEDLVAYGIDITYEFFPGHNTLVVAHMDTEHPHIHVVVQNLRAVDRDPQPWMEIGKDGNVIPSEIRAGGKHHHTSTFERALHDYALQLSRSYGLDDTDFREVARENQKKEVEQRREKLEEALKRIARDHPRGLSMRDFTSWLEFYCGARLVVRKGCELRIKFGTTGKAYTLSKWGLAAGAIDGILRPNKSVKKSEKQEVFRARSRRDLDRWTDAMIIARQEGLSSYAAGRGLAEMIEKELSYYRDQRDELYAAINRFRPYVAAIRSYYKMDAQLREMRAQGAVETDPEYIALEGKRDEMGMRLNIGTSDIDALLLHYDRLCREVEKCDKKLDDNAMKRLQRARTLEVTLGEQECKIRKYEQKQKNGGR